jgi:tetratricopeptide (TPR) repeat protein
MARLIELMNASRLRVLPAFFIAAIVVAAFSPVLYNEFVFWDDASVILENPNVRGLGWTHIRWMFTTFYMSLYRPLAWMTFAADYLAWGLNPTGYHATSLALHAANAALVYFIAVALYRIARPARADGEETPAALAAGFAAFFFALHPLAVEPVAWASAVSDPLAAFFIFLSLLCYLRAATDSKRGGWIAGAWAFYGLSVLSKASAVSFPIVLLVMDVYPLKRLGGARRWFGPETKRVWLEKLPFFALSAGAALLALSAKLFGETSWSNLVQPVFGVGFYLAKTLLPVHLSPVYSQEMPSDVWQLRFAPLAVLAIGVTAAAVGLRRRLPGMLAAWICYVALLLPSSGIVRYGPQLVADRYAYMPNAITGILIGGGVLYVLKRWAGKIVLTSAAAAALLLVMAILTTRQTLVWRDYETLFRHAVAVAPDSAFAHQNLASALANAGKLDEAVEHFRRALAIVDYAEAHWGLGVIFAQQEKFDAAIAEYRRALSVDAAYRPAREALAPLLLQQGRTAEAEAEYRAALKIDPTFIEAHNNLAALLAERGRFDEAVAELRQAVKLENDSAVLHANLAEALLQSGDSAAAAAEFSSRVGARSESARGKERLGAGALGKRRLTLAN